MSDKSESNAHTGENAAPNPSADVRGIVLSILVEHEHTGTYSSVLIRRAQDRNASLSLSQRSFLKRLAEGTIERRIELDSVIRRHLNSPEAKMKTLIRCLLRMSIYQIYYMDSVPDFAAVNEAVRLCRERHQESQVRFVNALLRSVCREKESAGRIRSNVASVDGRLSPGAHRKTQGSASASAGRNAEVSAAAGAGGGPAPAGRNARTAGAEIPARPGAPEPGRGAAPQEDNPWSMPQEILDLWRDQLGEERIAPLCEAMMQIRPVCIRLNPRLSEEGKKRVLENLAARGVLLTPGRWAQDCWCLRRVSRITELPGFLEGEWTVQDESSQLTAEAAGLAGRRADLSGPATVYDVCAAPGGKTVLAAALLPEGRVFAYDISKEKTARIRANLERMRLGNVTVGENDASGPWDEAVCGSADLVICDVPCSGLGVMTRKRDIKYNVTMQKIRSLAALQKRIAAGAARLVKPGGVLLYSTCTIDRIENERAADYIAANTDLVPEDIAPYLPEDLPGIDGSRVQLFPDLHGTDGFFMARFRRPL